MRNPLKENMLTRAIEATKRRWCDFTPEQKRACLLVNGVSFARPIIRSCVEVVDTTTRGDRPPSLKRRIAYTAIHAGLDLVDKWDGWYARKKGVTTPLGALEAVVDAVDFSVQEGFRHARRELGAPTLVARTARNGLSLAARAIEDERATKENRPANVNSKKFNKWVTFLRSVSLRTSDMFPKTTAATGVQHMSTVASVASALTNVWSFAGQKPKRPPVRERCV